MEDEEPPSPPTPPTPSPGNIPAFIRLVQIESKKDEAFYLNLFYRKEEKKISSRVGSGYNTFPVASDDLKYTFFLVKVLRIDDRDVFIQVKDKVYQWHVGDTLEHATAEGGPDPRNSGRHRSRSRFRLGQDGTRKRRKGTGKIETAAAKRRQSPLTAQTGKARQRICGPLETVFNQNPLSFSRGNDIGVSNLHGSLKMAGKLAGEVLPNLRGNARFEVFFTCGLGGNLFLSPFAPGRMMDGDGGRSFAGPEGLQHSERGLT